MKAKPQTWKNKSREKTGKLLAVLIEPISIVSLQSKQCQMLTTKTLAGGFQRYYTNLRDQSKLGADSEQTAAEEDVQ